MASWAFRRHIQKESVGYRTLLKYSLKLLAMKRRKIYFFDTIEFVNYWLGQNSTAEWINGQLDN